MKIQKLIFSLIGCLLFTTAQGANIDEMTLRGQGEAYYLKFIKVYKASLYTEENASLEEIASTSVSKCLLLQYQVAVDQDDFTKAANTVLERQFTDTELQEVQPEIDLLHKAYVDVKDGDQYTLCYNKEEESTTLEYNDVEIIRIFSKTFATIYFSIWLGEKDPLDDTLRDNLLTKTSK